LSTYLTKSTSFVPAGTDLGVKLLTDEGDINKFLGIEIKKITKNKFESSQPFLIKQIVNLLGLGQHEFDVHTKTKITPVGKPLLNTDLEGKPCKK
jgi:hypothetical protein